MRKIALFIIALCIFGLYKFLRQNNEREAIIQRKYVDPPHYERRPMGFIGTTPNGWQERYVKDTGYFFDVLQMGKIKQVRVDKDSYYTFEVGRKINLYDTAEYRKYLDTQNNQTRAVEWTR